MRIVSDLRVTNMYIHVDLTMNNTTTHTTSNTHTHTQTDRCHLFTKKQEQSAKKNSQLTPKVELALQLEETITTCYDCRRVDVCVRAPVG